MRRRDVISKLTSLAAFVGVCLLVCTPQVMHAQITGAITGTIVDQSGAVVPNASITITNTATAVVARTLTTGPSGTYVAEALPVGTYQVAVEARGFQRAVRSGII